LGGKFLADVNMDMVGENLELLHSQLIITRTPASTPSVLDDVIGNMTEMVDGMNIRTPRGSESVPNYRIVPYGGGSDHMMFIDRKIPGVMLVHSDYTHHTSDDTPDKVDPAELERCQMIGACSVWFLASLDQEKATDLLRLATGNALAALAASARSAQHLFLAQGIAANDSLRSEASNLLLQERRNENDRVASLLTFCRTQTLEAAVRARQSLFNQVYQTLAAELPPVTSRPQEAAADRRVPVRLTRGPLDFGLPETKLREQDRAWYHSTEFTLGGDERFEIVNFIDGKRSIREIRDLVSAEFHPVPVPVVARYIDDLVKAGVLRWAAPQEGIGAH
ncbi:MAG TPA: M28 family peptidase, partial [Bacteroidota bacterium]